MIIKLEKHDNISEIISNNNGASIIEFYAEWCGPCKIMKSIIEDVNKKYDKNINFYIVNVDNIMDNTLENYKITSVPFFLFIYNNEVIFELLGAIPKFKLEKKIDRFMELIEQKKKDNQNKK